MLLKEYIWYWYNTYAKSRQRQNTQYTNILIIKKHICENEIGNQEIELLMPIDIQRFFNYCLTDGYKGHGRVNGIKRGLSNSCVIKIRQLLMRMFDHACREGIINCNPVKMTEPIPVAWSDKPVFSQMQQVRFLEFVKNDRFYLAFVLLFFLGMRRSEVLGLSWNNVDLKRNVLRISQTMIVIDRTPVLYQNTKTKSSLRSIPFPVEIHRLFISLKRLQKYEKVKNDDNLVFITSDGTPYSPDAFSNRFKYVIKKLGFNEKLHLHSARHTWATNMMQIGSAINDVQALGGWSDPSMLLEVYAHSVKRSQTKAINKLFKEYYSL